MTDHTTTRRTTDETPAEKKAPENDGDGTVEVVGERAVSLSHSDFDDLPVVERTCTVTCASGDRTTAQWTGVTVLALLDHAAAPAETTHLLVESDDGYRACVALRDARTALLAVEQDGHPLGAVETYATRFVGPSIEGERAVKGVIRIEAVTLGSGDDPTDLERLSLDDPAYG